MIAPKRPITPIAKEAKLPVQTPSIPPTNITTSENPKTTIVSDADEVLTLIFGAKRWFNSSII